jgi:CRISPR system Cascade subunit CasD
MPDHLVFTLTASLAAMGDLAGHERRGSLLWPGRSAILGLLGAALGLRREDDFSRLDALSVAVAVLAPGATLRDYHTVQTVPSAAVRRPNSRPQALQDAGLRVNTTITHRDYRCGVACGVVVSGDDLPPLAEALRRPHFTLYFGRKSCPLSSPPDPQLWQAPSPEAALAALTLPPWLDRPAQAQWVTDAESPQDAHIEERHDRPLDRGLWHFAPRRVAVRSIDLPKGVA